MWCLTLTLPVGPPSTCVLTVAAYLAPRLGLTPVHPADVIASVLSSSASQSTPTSMKAAAVVREAVSTGATIPSEAIATLLASHITSLSLLSTRSKGPPTRGALVVSFPPSIAAAEALDAALLTPVSAALSLTSSPRPPLSGPATPLSASMTAAVAAGVAAAEAAQNEWFHARSGRFYTYTHPHRHRPEPTQAQMQASTFSFPLPAPRDALTGETLTRAQGRAPPQAAAAAAAAAAGAGEVQEWYARALPGAHSHFGVTGGCKGEGRLVVVPVLPGGGILASDEAGLISVLSTLS